MTFDDFGFWEERREFSAEPSTSAKPLRARGRRAPAVSRRPSSEAEQQLERLRRETGILAHDFNNLLHIILVANEALAECVAIGSEAHELATVSQEAAEKGAELLQRIVALSNPQAASDADTVNCSELIGVVARMARLAAPPTVIVESRASEDPLNCAVNAADLESALLNLCVNAGHAMPAGGSMVISASSAVLDEADAQALRLTPGAYAVVSVADTGVGMSSETLRRAVEPYFTTRRGRGGTGLGLASVQDFAIRANGRMTLASELGMGTTVTLYLPRS